MGSMNGPSLLHLLQFLGSFALVVALLLALAWGLKKLQGSAYFQRRGGRIELLETMPMAPRMKLALVRAGPREFLLGITPGRISRIGQWNIEPDDAPPAGDTTAAPAPVADR
jgi:flagellar biosynthetic protein FliO